MTESTGPQWARVTAGPARPARLVGAAPGVLLDPGARAAGVPEPDVIGVVGACGGAGASTFAAALAYRLSDGGPTALVDLDRAGGGLDVLLGLESDDGVRWPDLEDARGLVSGRELEALLPRWGRCLVLSADRLRPGPPPEPARDDVLRALAAQHTTTVLDLDRADVLDRGPTLTRCRTVLLVVPRDLRSVAGVLALRPALVDVSADVRLVVRGPAPGGLGVLELAHVVDLPVVTAMPSDRGVAAAAERGGGPRSRRGPLGRAVGRVVGALR